MNIFCPNKRNPKVKAEFDEMVALFGKDAAYYLWNKNNGYPLDKDADGNDKKEFDIDNRAELLKQEALKLTKGTSVKIKLQSKEKNTLPNWTLTIAGEKGAEFIMNHLQALYPDVKVFNDKQAFLDYVEKHGGTKEDLDAMGMAFRDAVFIDSNTATQATPIHEFSHLYFDALPENDPLKQRLLTLFGYDTNMTPKERIAVEEQIMDAVTNAGQLISDPSLPTSFRTEFIKWLKDFWRAVKAMFGNTQAKKERLSEQLFQEIWNNKRKYTSEDFNSGIIKNMLGLFNFSNIPEFENTRMVPEWDKAKGMVGVSRLRDAYKNNTFNLPRYLESRGKEFSSLHNISPEQGRAMAQFELDMSAKMGTMVHELNAFLAVAYNDKLNNFKQAVPVPDRFKDLFDNEKAFNDYVRQYNEMLDSIVDNLKKAGYKKIKLHPEASIGNLDCMARGIADLVVEVDDNKIIIYDYKTSEKSKYDETGNLSSEYMLTKGSYKGVLSKLNENQYTDHKLQLNCYANLLGELFYDPSLGKHIKFTTIELGIIPLQLKTNATLIDPNGSFEPSNIKITLAGVTPERIINVERDATAKDAAAKILANAKAIITYQEYSDYIDTLKERLRVNGNDKFYIHELIKAINDLNLNLSIVDQSKEFKTNRLMSISAQQAQELMGIGIDKMLFDLQDLHGWKLGELHNMKASEIVFAAVTQSNKEDYEHKKATKEGIEKLKELEEVFSELDVAFKGFQGLQDLVKKPTQLAHLIEKLSKKKLDSNMEALALLYQVQAAIEIADAVRRENAKDNFEAKPYTLVLAKHVNSINDSRKNLYKDAWIGKILLGFLNHRAISHKLLPYQLVTHDIFVKMGEAVRVKNENRNFINKMVSDNIDLEALTVQTTYKNGEPARMIFKTPTELKEHAKKNNWNKNKLDKHLEALDKIRNYYVEYDPQYAYDKMMYEATKNTGDEHKSSPIYFPDITILPAEIEKSVKYFLGKAVKFGKSLKARNLIKIINSAKWDSVEIDVTDYLKETGQDYNKSGNPMTFKQFKDSFEFLYDKYERLRKIQEIPVAQREQFFNEQFDKMSATQRNYYKQKLAVFEKYFKKYDKQAKSLYEKAPTKYTDGNKIFIQGKGKKKRTTKDMFAALETGMNSVIDAHYKNKALPVMNFIQQQYMHEHGRDTAVSQNIEWMKMRDMYGEQAGKWLPSTGGAIELLLMRIGSLGIMALSVTTQMMNKIAGVANDILHIKTTGHWYFDLIKALATAPVPILAIKFIKHNIKLIGIMKSIGVVNLAEDTYAGQYKSFGTKLEELAYILMKFVEYSNQLPMFAGSIKKMDVLNDYDDNGKLLPGKKGLSEMQIKEAKDNVSRVSGDYYKYGQGPLMDANGIRLIAQFKKWIPAMLLRTMATGFIDSTGKTNLGVLPTMYFALLKMGALTNMGSEKAQQFQNEAMEKYERGDELSYMERQLLLSGVKRFRKLTTDEVDSLFRGLGIIAMVIAYYGMPRVAYGGEEEKEIFDEYGLIPSEHTLLYEMFKQSMMGVVLINDTQLMKSFDFFASVGVQTLYKGLKFLYEVGLAIGDVIIGDVKGAKYERSKGTLRMADEDYKFKWTGLGLVPFGAPVRQGIRLYDAKFNNLVKEEADRAIKIARDVLNVKYRMTGDQFNIYIQSQEMLKMYKYKSQVDKAEAILLHLQTTGELEHLLEKTVPNKAEVQRTMKEIRPKTEKAKRDILKN